MELIRTWILSVTVSAMVIAVAQALMPAGAVKKVGQLTGGLILVLGMTTGTSMSWSPPCLPGPSSRRRRRLAATRPWKPS